MGGGAETQSDFIFSSQILNWLPIILMELHGVPFILNLQSKETKYTQAKFKFSTLWRIEIFCENWNSWASSKHVATRPWPDKLLLLIHGSWNLSSKNHLGVRRWGNWGGGEHRRQLAGIIHRFYNQPREKKPVSSIWVDSHLARGSCRPLLDCLTVSTFVQATVIIQ